MVSVNKRGKGVANETGNLWLPVFNRNQLLGSRRQVMLLI